MSFNNQNIMQAMKQAQKLQEDMKNIQEKLKNTDFLGQSGGGMVKATITGAGIVKDIDIDVSLLRSEEKELLQDLLIAALNHAKASYDSSLGDAMQKLGVNPELIKMMGM